MEKFKLKNCGSLIKNARESKDITIDELRMLIKNKNINNKLIKKWEESKAYPNLEMCYKLAEILEISPTELLNLRNYERKKFKVKVKKKRWFNSEVPEDFFLILKGVLGLIVILIALWVGYMVLKLDFAVKYGGKEELEKIVVETIDKSLENNM